MTGGSSGLGLELCRRFVARGVSVTIVARDRDRLSACADELTRLACDGASVATVSVDVAVPDSVERAVTGIARIRPLDGVVTSAGIMREGRVGDLSLADYSDVLDINVLGTIAVIRAALPHLPRPGGLVVPIASVAGLTGVYGYTAYCAAKHAIVGFADALRYEVEPDGIGVQLVCPGEFDSPFVDALDKTRTPENRAHTLTIPKLPAGRIADSVIASMDRGGSRRVVPGTMTQLIVLGQHLAPAAGRFVGRRKIAAVQNAMPAPP
ncbi:SDR family oxidoreductase [Williamsia serinedens]